MVAGFVHAGQPDRLGLLPVDMLGDEEISAVDAANVQEVVEGPTVIARERAKYRVVAFAAPTHADENWRQSENIQVA